MTYSVQIDAIIYREPFRSMSDNERRALIDAIRDQLGDTSDEWIRCSDRMPQFDVEVNISLQKSVMAGTFYTTGIWKTKFGSFSHTPERVSHWRPLPAPPTE